MENRIFKHAAKSEVQAFWNNLSYYRPALEDESIIFISYLLYLRNTYDKEDSLSLSELLDKKFSSHSSNVEYVIRDSVNEPLWNNIKNRVGNISNEILETVILDTNKMASKTYAFNTPDTLVELALKILDIKAGENVCDICGGVGNFTIKAFLQQQQAYYYSKDINSTVSAIIEIRKDVLTSHYNNDLIDTATGDSLDDFTEENHQLYDKVFGNYPWMIDFGNKITEDRPFLKELQEKIPGIMRINASDWLFNFLMIHMMKDSGKAIGIMTNGSTWNKTTGCREARTFFLKNGLIEAVIALPPRVFTYTAIPTSLVVFSHGNKTVKMIDASNICTEYMRQTVFTSENISSIISAYKNDGEYSITVSNEDIIEKNESVIHPSRYLAETIPVKDGKPLGSVLKDIYRGASIGAKELDSLLTDTPSEYQYLRMNKITDGVIDTDLPYISKLDKKYEKFIAPNRSVIISKMGTPFKCAVIENEPGRKIIVNGNMFILEVDETKANPYYIEALFESSYGAGLLSSICTGTAIQSFNKKALEELVIPIPSLEKQNSIANEYLKLQDEIQIYKIKVAKASEKKSHIFDDMKED